jgi:hypothetical protein
LLRSIQPPEFREIVTYRNPPRSFSSGIEYEPGPVTFSRSAPSIPQMLDESLFGPIFNDDSEKAIPRV